MGIENEGILLADVLRASEGQLELLDASPAARDGWTGSRISQVRIVATADRVATGADRFDPDEESPGARLWVLMPPAAGDAADYASTVDLAVRELPAGPVVVWPGTGLDAAALRSLPRTRPVLVAARDVSAEDVVLLAAAALGGRPDSSLRRLTSLQRGLTQALSSENPVADLVDRLARTCNAAAALVDSRGVALLATAPLPLSRFVEELRRAPAHERLLDMEGWRVAAVPVGEAEGEADHPGWLLAASRRETFPDPLSVAAVHIAASLVETSGRVDRMVRLQEEAITSALLEQVLALRLQRHDAELAGRVAALGFSFAAEVRSFQVQLPRGMTRGARAEAAERLHGDLRRLLVAEDVPHLLSPREGGVVGVAQAPVHRLRQWLTSTGGRGCVVGIGRDAGALGEVVDSQHDAQLALRALARGTANRDVMAYEDFDFSTRLFSDVGLEKMTAWADSLLEPVRHHQILMDGLRRYFEYDMNIINAAQALNVHHNSLRYRLAKVEELLGISLRDPAAISSLYLALTAQGVSAGVGAPAPSPRVRKGTRGGTTTPGSAENAVNSSSRRPRRASPGVVVGPDR